jgi:hypothetical protein
MAEDDFGEAAKYFGKKKAGREPTFERMEESIGVEKTLPPTPPPEKPSSLQSKSVKGSGSMTKKEIEQGFRRVGVKLDYCEDVE